MYPWFDVFWVLRLRLQLCSRETHLHSLFFSWGREPQPEPANSNTLGFRHRGGKSAARSYANKPADEVFAVHTKDPRTITYLMICRELGNGSLQQSLHDPVHKSIP